MLLVVNFMVSLLLALVCAGHPVTVPGESDDREGAPRGTPSSAPAPLVRLSARNKADEGVGRGPGGPPHNANLLNRYFSDNYIQHNPTIPNGKEAIPAVVAALYSRA